LYRNLIREQKKRKDFFINVNFKNNLFDFLFFNVFELKKILLYRLAKLSKKNKKSIKLISTL